MTDIERWKTGVEHLRAGRLAEAREALGPLADVETPPDRVREALGLIAVRRGEWDEALRWMEPVIGPNSAAGAWYNLGLAYAGRGRGYEAEAAFRQALELRPDYPEAIAGLGQIALQRSDWAGALLRFEAALLLNPDHPDVLNNCAVALRFSGRKDEARERLLRALSVNPDHELAVGNLFELDLVQGGVERCIEEFSDLERRHPSSWAVRDALRRALTMTGRTEEALEKALVVAGLRPDAVYAQIVVGSLLFDLDRPGDALDYVAKFEERSEPGHAEGFLFLSKVLRFLGFHDEAGHCVDQARELAPDSIPALLSKVIHSAAQGREVEALELIRSEHEKRPTPEIAGEYAHMLRRFRRDAEAKAVLEPWVHSHAVHRNILVEYADLVKDPLVTERAVQQLKAEIKTEFYSANLVTLHFNIAGLLEQLKRYDEAFAHWKSANELRYARYNREFTDLDFRLRVAAQTSPTLADTPVHRPPRAFVPIFIVGMPRSGTTLVEEILSSHPDVSPGGEMGGILIPLQSANAGDRLSRPDSHLGDPAFLDQVAREATTLLERAAAGRPFVTDKTPLHFLHVPLIHKLFPDAPIVHCTRDPRDNGLSLYQQNFASRFDFAYDLPDIAHYYRHYHDMMAAWRAAGARMLEVPYEEVVSDVERVARGLAAHCGLTWDDRMLRHHENKRAINTASWNQATKPIYRTSVAKWRHYEAHLGPLLDGVADLVGAGS
jgi:tetratricopeptide (TPR) repeat protein